MILQVGAQKDTDGAIVTAYCLVDTKLTDPAGNHLIFHHAEALHPNANIMVIARAMTHCLEKVTEAMASQAVFSPNPALTYALNLPATLEAS